MTAASSDEKSPANQLLENALRYARDGWYVFPVGDESKVPITAHGHLDATVDPDRIAKWWTEHPDANIGLWLRKSGLIAVDVDPDHGGDATLAALEHELGALPRVVHQRTGSGGEHVIMRDPVGDPDSRVSMPGGLGQGVDVKCNGYVLLEPSRSSKGSYVWLARDLSKLPGVPATWLPRLQPKTASTSALGVSVDDWEKSSGELSPADEEALCAILETLKRGQGQSATFRAIKAIFHDFGRSIGEGEIYLRAWNDECGKPYSDDALERQVERVAARDLEPARGHMLEVRRAAAAASIARIVGANAHSQSPHANPYTDLGNAERFVSEHKERIRYVHAWRSWLIWDGAHWKPDEGGEIHRLVYETVRKMGVDAAKLPMDEEGKRQQALRWATQSANRQRLMAIEDIARHMQPVVIAPDKLNTDPWLFNAQNGTIDLRTGTLRPHAQADFITKLVPIAFDPLAQCPLWDGFLLKVFPSSQALRDFVQRAVGYSLTGSPQEQCMFILFGRGCNGKSTFVETLREVFGKYGFAAAMSVFIAKKGDDGVSTDLKALDGRRFVTAVESEQGRALAEALIKSVTGGDVINARELYQRGEQFKATCKLWFSTNHKPSIKGTDDGIWRRLRLIPFAYKFTDAEKDEAFGEKLKSELAGILRWAVEGAVKWSQHKLGSCPEVDQALASYRAEMDPVGPFVEDNCIVDPSQDVTGQALYGSYKQWCVDNSCHAISEREFRGRLDALGFQKFEKTVHHKMRAAYMGIGLRASGSLSQVLLAQRTEDPGKPTSDEESAISRKNSELPMERHEER